MISVLIADDSDAKTTRVIDVLNNFICEDLLKIDRARSGASAAALLKDHKYDLLIIDLVLPMRDSETPIPDGGIRLLQELHKKGFYKRPNHIVGLTAFSDLVDQQAKAFDDKLWHLIPFKDDSNEWASALGQKLVHIAEAQSPLRTDGYNYSLGIVTALHKVELEMVLTLPANWTTKQIEGDDTVYHIGEFSNGIKKLSVVAAAAPEMGMPATATLASNMIYSFRPKVLCLAGIAAGIKGQFGDILVADQCWDYGSGKVWRPAKASQSMFLPAPSTIPLSPALKAKVNLFSLDEQKVQRCKSGWPGKESQTFLAVHIGPIASGAAVVQDKKVIEELVARHRKLVGIEMETYGLFCAANYAQGSKPLAMAAKSICDFGDSSKNDDYQKYAAYTSARFVYEFALDQLS